MKSSTTLSVDPRLESFLRAHNGEDVLKIIAEEDAALLGHQQRVARMSSRVAGLMGLSDATEQTIFIAASLHDIGMYEFSLKGLSVADELSRLWEDFKSHPQFGAELLEGLTDCEAIIEIVLQHHERQDGGGFPHGITEVRLEAQILAAVDMLDGVYCLHPHNVLDAINAARDEMNDLRNGKLSSQVLDATIKLLDRGEYARCL
jgi:HD-GYP domain-containing protein (c-di-GMP phosphodiesterase class II)